MAIDRSNHPWPEDFSYELDELHEAALYQVILDVQNESRAQIRSVGERAFEFGSDGRTAA